MNVVAFFSSKGAPGTTTAAMLAASLWPRPALLADCDPAGGDLALRLPAPDGRPLDPSRGVLSLLPIARRGLDPDALREHVQEVLGGGEVLVGMTGPEQAAAAGPLWSTIAERVRRAARPRRPRRRRPARPALAGAAARDLGPARGLRARLSASPACTPRGPGCARCFLRCRRRTAAGPRVGVVVRGRDKREAQEAGQVIQGEFPSVAYWGRLAEDASGAGIFDGRPVSRPERTLLARAGSEVVAAMQEELNRLQVSRTPSAEQPWNSFTGAYAAYAPYLKPAGDAPAPPKRSRSEERRLSRKKAK